MLIERSRLLESLSQQNNNSEIDVESSSISNKRKFSIEKKSHTFFFVINPSKCWVFCKILHDMQYLIDRFFYIHHGNKNSFVFENIIGNVFL